VKLAISCHAAKMGPIILLSKEEKSSHKKNRTFTVESKRRQKNLTTL
jgi:hypothetical protein